MKYYFLLSLLFLILSSSNDLKQTDQEEIENNTSFVFEDGFETDSTNFSLLFSNDNSRWTTIQLINPNNPTNSLEISSMLESERNRLLKIQSRHSNEILSKSDIKKGGFTAPANSNITIEANFFTDTDNDGIPDDDDIDDDNDGILDTRERVLIRGFAASGTATQSSTLVATPSPEASNAIDRNTSSALGIASTAGITATDWWEVDLGGNRLINLISIFNVDDCCQDRLANVYVLIADTPFPVDPNDLAGALANADFRFQLPATITGDETIPVPSVAGRYVRLQKSGNNPGGNSINIAEVQIRGRDLDGDGIANELDIDLDNDGITDNIEAQATNAYIAPSGMGGTADFIDSNLDGLDDNYDAGVIAGGTPTGEGLTPVDTQFDGFEDYYDTNTDNDLVGDDIAERGDGGPTTITDIIDTDRDGLLDIFEGAAINDGFDVNDENIIGDDGGSDGSFTSYNLAASSKLAPDGSNAIDGITDLNFRQGPDTDNDGIADIADIDDDNDGILDIDELTSGINYSFFNTPFPDPFSLPETGEDASGITSNFDVEALASTLPGGNEDYSFRFTGLLNIEFTEDYTLYLNSVNSSRVFIDEVQLNADLNPDGDFVTGFTTLMIKGLHRIEIVMTDTGGPGSLAIEYSSASVPRQAIFPQLFIDTDTDADGMLNRHDLDADEDGCFDAQEAGHNQIILIDGTITDGSDVGTNGFSALVETDDTFATLPNYTVISTVPGIFDFLNFNIIGTGCQKDYMRHGKFFQNGKKQPMDFGRGN